MYHLETEIQDFQGIAYFKQAWHRGINLLSGPYGSGKTSVLNAIAWCLWNEIPDSAGAADVIRDFQPACKVRHAFMWAGARHEALRRRTAGGAHEFWFDGKGGAGEARREAEDRIAKLFGPLTYGVLAATVLAKQKKLEEALTMKPAGLRNLLASLLGADCWQDAAVESGKRQREKLSAAAAAAAIKARFMADADGLDARTAAREEAESAAVFTAAALDEAACAAQAARERSTELAGKAAEGVEIQRKISAAFRDLETARAALIRLPSPETAEKAAEQARLAAENAEFSVAATVEYAQEARDAEALARAAADEAQAAQAAAQAAALAESAAVNRLADVIAGREKLERITFRKREQERLIAVREEAEALSAGLTQAQTDERRARALYQQSARRLAETSGACSVPAAAQGCDGTGACALMLAYRVAQAALPGLQAEEKKTGAALGLAENNVESAADAVKAQAARAAEEAKSAQLEFDRKLEESLELLRAQARPELEKLSRETAAAKKEAAAQAGAIQRWKAAEEARAAAERKADKARADERRALAESKAANEAARRAALAIEEAKQTVSRKEAAHAALIEASSGRDFAAEEAQSRQAAALSRQAAELEALRKREDESARKQAESARAAEAAALAAKSAAEAAALSEAGSLAEAGVWEKLQKIFRAAPHLLIERSLPALQNMANDFLLNFMAARAAGPLELEFSSEQDGAAADKVLIRARDGSARRAAGLCSGGEQQWLAGALRLALAGLSRGRMAEFFEFFIFDEPFTGLDPEGLEEARKLLKALSAEGRQIILISHLPEIREAADKIIEIEPSFDGGSRARADGGGDDDASGERRRQQGELSL